MENPKHDGLPRREAGQEEEEEDDDQQPHGQPLQQQDQPHNQAVESHDVEMKPIDSNASEEAQAMAPFLSGETHQDAAGKSSPHKTDIKMKGVWSDPEIIATDRPKKSSQIAEDVREMKKACGSQLVRKILCKPNRFKNEEPRLQQCSNVAEIESAPFDPLTFKNLELEKGSFIKPTAQRKEIREEEATPLTKGNALLVTFTDGSQQWVERRGIFLHGSEGSQQLDIGDQNFDSAERQPDHPSISCKKNAVQVAFTDGSQRWVEISGRFLHWPEGSRQLDFGDQNIDSAERHPDHQSILGKHEKDTMETEPESEIRPIEASLPFEKHLSGLKLDIKVPTMNMQIPTSGPEKEAREIANAESGRLRRKRSEREEAQWTKKKFAKDVRHVTEGCRPGGSKPNPDGSDEDSTDNDSPLPSKSVNVNM